MDRRDGFSGCICILSTDTPFGIGIRCLTCSKISRSWRHHNTTPTSTSSLPVGNCLYTRTPRQLSSSSNSTEYKSRRAYRMEPLTPSPTYNRRSLSPFLWITNVICCSVSTISCCTFLQSMSSCPPPALSRNTALRYAGSYTPEISKCSPVWSDGADA